ncbi:MAG TPA: hypothetical protein VK615_07315 [Candidatus Binatia bacterium]|nr:hypothetical protein [Candidatus Binatia bacterium]
MTWNRDDLVEFFGVQPETSTIEGFGRVHSFWYSGERLQYLIYVDEDIDSVCVSGDPSAPFGGDSLYEVCVPCDCIKVFPDPYHKGQVALAFYYGPTNDPANRRLTLMKRPDRDLKAWPTFPMPQAHHSRPVPKRDNEKPTNPPN